MIPDRKVCGQCHIEKDKSEFSIRKKGKDGEWSWLRLECKDCENKKRRLRYTVNRDKIIKRNKEYTQHNKEKVYQRQSKWNEENKEYVKDKRRRRYLEKGEIIREKRKKYYYENREKCIEGVNNYQKNNLQKVRKTQRNRHEIRKDNDLSYRIVRILRGRVFMAIKNKGKRCSRTRQLIGCTIPFLIKYIEERFTDGMTWDNQGLRGWHIDHIKPCSKFDLTKPEEQKKCFHYTNLQPLWWRDNLIKSDKYEELT
jgi:hypothetical protein